LKGKRKEKEKRKREKEIWRGTRMRNEGKVPGHPLHVGQPEIRPNWPIGKFSAIRRKFPIGG